MNNIILEKNYDTNDFFNLEKENKNKLIKETPNYNNFNKLNEVIDTSMFDIQINSNTVTDNYEQEFNMLKETPDFSKYEKQNMNEVYDNSIYEDFKDDVISVKLFENIATNDMMLLSKRF